jgi:hypothetical protein
MAAPMMGWALGGVMSVMLTLAACQSPVGLPGRPDLARTVTASGAEVTSVQTQIATILPGIQTQVATAVPALQTQVANAAATATAAARR